MKMVLEFMQVLSIAAVEMKPMKRIFPAALCGLLVACSPVLEATRPDPVDTTQFTVGEGRINVMAELGNPAATMTDAGNSCDIYKLFTKGPSAAGKGALAAGEVIADVFTLGLAEVIFTPVEAATRNSKHTVVICYGGDGKLASLRESDKSVDH